MEVVRYKHMVNSGDLIATLAGIKHVYDTTGKKAVIMQTIDTPGNYFGYNHPCKDANGVPVTMSKKQWSMLVPLLESQEYVDHCEVWEGQEVDVDLNKIREGNYSTLPFGSINKWCAYGDPALNCDYSLPWITVPKLPAFKDKIIINLTERYRNPFISYYFLKPYEQQLVFAGTIGEYEQFISKYKLDAEYLEVEDFYQLAIHLNSCKFGIYNQSMCYNAAESIKAPRILEVCKEAPNCVPFGPHAADFLHQGALEFYFEQYLKKY